MSDGCIKRIRPYIIATLALDALHFIHINLIKIVLITMFDKEKIAKLAYRQVI